MKKILIAISMVALMSGCSTMTPARYSASADNQMVLRSLPDASAHISEVTISTDYNASCRMMGPVQAVDGMTVPEFIGQAMEEEFKMAGIYSTEGSSLTGDIRRLAFSSVSGLTGGWWDIEMTLTSPNGESVDAEIRYEFTSGFDAITACNQTAQALGPAVQDLINQLISNPNFAVLVQTN